MLNKPHNVIGNHLMIIGRHHEKMFRIDITFVAKQNGIFFVMIVILIREDVKK